MSRRGSEEPEDRLITVLSRLPTLAIAAVVLLVTAYFVWFVFVNGQVLSSDSQHWGTFGDFLGGVLNPLLAFLSFIAILATLNMQRRELKISSEELRNSVSALGAQTEVMRSQSFDSLFFQMLKLHNDIVAQMDLVDSDGNIIARARDCFRTFERRLANSIKDADYDLAHVERAMKGYEKFYVNHYRELGHYFRLLYHLVRLVDESAFNDDTKRIYTNVIRAQLSDSEQMLLFFNCLSKWGNEKFKPLVEKYALLKTIRAEPPISKAYRAAYHPTAFGREVAFH